MLSKEQIAQRIAKEVKNGQYINLGIGIPTLVANYIPDELEVVLQSENGLLGIGPFPTEDKIDPDLINAGKQTITMVKGSVLFNSAESFAMIRGGHVHLTILGAMEVSENGDGVVSGPRLGSMGCRPSTQENISQNPPRFGQQQMCWSPAEHSSLARSGRKHI